MNSRLATALARGEIQVGANNLEPSLRCNLQYQLGTGDGSWLSTLHLHRD